MSRIASALKRLNRDSLPHYLRILWQLALEPATTIIVRLKARWWGVSFGVGNVFVGDLSFVRARGSTISIGSRGRFVSTQTANRHGVNRRCMITTLAPSASISIGDRAGFSGAVICAARKVEIGNRVMLGANVTITDTDSHPIDFRQRHPDAFAFDAESVVTGIKARPVVIEDDVFVGMHSLVLKGVTIGRGSVIGAGSVVTTSIPENSIAAGNPARVLKQFDPNEEAMPEAEIHDHFE